MRTHYTAEELAVLHHDKEKLRIYFTEAAIDLFKNANAETDSVRRLQFLKMAISLFKCIDDLVEDTYKP
jgi:hypothetical protein